MDHDSLLDFYKSHGIMTAPKEYSYVLDKFSKGIPELCNDIHNVLVIDFLVNMGCFNVSNEYLSDMNIRSLEGKIIELLKRNNKIDKIVSVENRIIGNCRDVSLFICSILRHNNISARVRSGFATFFDAYKKFDHWLCEYWDIAAMRWKRIDLWMSQIKKEIDLLPPMYSQGFSKLNYDPVDVGSEFFLSGSEAWLKCRKNKDNPEMYGTYQKGLEGLWFIRDNMIRDIFCMNKIEMLPWDCLKSMGKGNSAINDDDLLFFDKLAEIAATTNENKLFVEMDSIIGKFTDNKCIEIWFSK